MFEFISLGACRCMKFVFFTPGFESRHLLVDYIPVPDAMQGSLTLGAEATARACQQSARLVVRVTPAVTPLRCSLADRIPPARHRVSS